VEPVQEQTLTKVLESESVLPQVLPVPVKALELRQQVSVQVFQVKLKQRRSFRQNSCSSPLR
jgi:hypothetical protein